MLSQLHFPAKRVSGKPHCTCTKPAEIGPPLLSAGVVNADRWSTNTELQHNQSVTSLPQIALALFKHEVQRKCNQERINLNPDRKKESRVQRFILIHSDQASTMIRVRERGREGTELGEGEGRGREGAPGAETD